MAVVEKIINETENNEIALTKGIAKIQANYDKLYLKVTALENELKNKTNELEEEKKEKSKLKLEIEKQEILKKYGFDNEILDFIDGSDIIEVEEKAKKFENYLDSETQKKVEKRIGIANTIPEAGRPPQVLTLEIFKKMNLNERLQNLSKMKEVLNG